MQGPTRSGALSDNSSTTYSDGHIYKEEERGVHSIDLLRIRVLIALGSTVRGGLTLRVLWHCGCGRHIMEWQAARKIQTHWRIHLGKPCRPRALYARAGSRDFKFVLSH